MNKQLVLDELEKLTTALQKITKKIEDKTQSELKDRYNVWLLEGEMKQVIFKSGYIIENINGRTEEQWHQRSRLHKRTKD